MFTEFEYQIKVILCSFWIDQFYYIRMLQFLKYFYFLLYHWEVFIPYVLFWDHLDCYVFLFSFNFSSIHSSEWTCTYFSYKAIRANLFIKRLVFHIIIFFIINYHIQLMNILHTLHSSTNGGLSSSPMSNNIVPNRLYLLFHIPSKTSSLRCRIFHAQNV